jgi:hypothetical protein
MNNKKILKLFITFLRKENIYKDYIEGLKRGANYRANCSRMRERDELEWLVKTIKFCPQNLIVDAFSWNYYNAEDWLSINDKWREILCYKEYE